MCFHNKSRDIVDSKIEIQPNPLLLAFVRIQHAKNELKRTSKQLSIASSQSQGIVMVVPFICKICSKSVSYTYIESSMARHIILIPLVLYWHVERTFTH